MRYVVLVTNSRGMAQVFGPYKSEDAAERVVREVERHTSLSALAMPVTPQAELRASLAFRQAAAG